MDSSDANSSAHFSGARSPRLAESGTDGRRRVPSPRDGCETEPVTDQQLDDLAQMWEWFAAGSCRGYSPIYDQIASSVAHDPEILALVRQTPPQCHLPLSLLAAVHYLVLDGLDHPLGRRLRGSLRRGSRAPLRRRLPSPLRPGDGAHGRATRADQRVRSLGADRPGADLVVRTTASGHSRWWTSARARG